MRIRSGLRLIASLLLVIIAAGLRLLEGQVKDVIKPATGSVTGHVYCADTNAPARLASVMLQPALRLPRDRGKEPKTEPAAARGQGAHDGATPPEAPTMTVVQTSLDGSFAIQKVKPGTYYLVIEKQGYVSPLAEFPIDEIEKPTPELEHRMEKALHKVIVEANQTTQVEERIERGGAVSGAVSFDDGSPAAGLSLHLLEKKKDGFWADVVTSTTSLNWVNHSTDDEGRYRLPGLPAGEYMVEVKMEMTETKVTRSSTSSNTWYGNPKFSLSFFSGGATRKKDAAAFKVGAGEERDGEHITIPLTKLHRVTGTLIAAHDGHVIDAASVSLLYSDDKTELARADVGEGGPTFDFQFVPEGDYVLKVSNARDATWVETPQAPGQFGFMPPEEKAEHWYGEKEQPFNVRGDTTGLVVSVPEKGPAVVAGAAQGGGSR